MKYWKLRVDLNDTRDFDDVLAVVKKNSDCYIGSFEFHSKDGKITKHHTHWYFESITKGPTIRAQLKKLGMERSEYSFGELEEEKPMEYLAYITKEDTKPVIVGFDVDFIQKIKEYNLKVKSEIKEKKELKKTKIQQMEIAFNLHKPNSIEFLQNPQYFTRHQMLDKIVKWYQEKEILPRRHAIIAECDFLMLKYIPEFRKSFVDKLDEMSA